MALFNIFWKLADDEEARLAGVTELLSLLQAERRAAPDKNTPQESMQYSLKRLVRGLGSSRGGARQGFSAALTEVLLHFPEVPTAQVMELASQSLNLSNEANKQEKKDFYMGRIFLALVIAKSGRLGQLSAQEATVMVDQLIQLGQEKPLLREACFETLGLLAISLSTVEGEVRNVVLSRVAKLFASDLAWDCDLLNLALIISTAGDAILSQFPTSVRQAPAKASKHKTALSESTRVYPSIHSVWRRLLDILFAESSYANLSSFWLAIVDGELFNNPRPKCKHLGFCLFELILNRLTNQKEIPRTTADKKKKKRKKPEEDEDSEKEDEVKEEKKEEVKAEVGPVALKAIASLFSKHFIRTLVNNLSAKATQLREAALHTRNALLHAAKGRPGVALVMANHLGGSAEGAHFDTRTKGKTVSLLLGQLNEDGVAEYLKSLFAAFSHVVQIFPTEEEVSQPELFSERQQKQTEISRAGQLEQLYAMSKNSHLSRASQQGCLSDILEFFLRHGFFEDSTVALSPKTKELCRHKFFTLITDLLPGRISSPRGEKGESAPEETKTPKTAQYEDLWALKAHQMWNKLVKQHQLVTPLSPTDLSVREKTLALVSTITKRVVKIKALADKATTKAKAHEHTAKIAKLHALQLLLLQLSLLQLKAGDLQPTQLLQEVEMCYTKLFDSKETSKTQSDDEPTPVEVLVDILLALLVTESGHIREVANQVMQAFNDALTPKALQSLVAVLVAKDQPGGDEEDEEGEEESDEETQEAKTAEPQEDEEEEMSDDSEEELIGLASLQDMLAANPEPGFDSAEKGDEDDTEMDKYDKALADMMRLRQEKKNAGKDLRRLSLNFKLRVLDLLALFVKKNPENPLILDLLKPMLDAFHAARGSTENVVLHDRLLALFRKLCKPSEYPTIGDKPGCAPTAAFKALFEELLQRAQKTVHRDDLSLVSMALLFMVRMWVPLGDSQGSTPEGGWVVEQYSAALKVYLTSKKSNLNTKFFTDFIARFPVLGFALTAPLIQLSCTGAKEFQRIEAFALLRVLFQSKGDLKSQAVNSLGPSLGKALVAALIGHAADTKLDKRAKIALQTVNDFATLVKKTSGKVDLGTGVSQALATAAGSDKLKKFINNLVRNAKLDFDFSLLKK